jgi:hypothetical protein
MGRCQFFGLFYPTFLVHQTGYQLRFLTKNIVITAYLGASMRDTPLRRSTHGKRPRPELARKAPGMSITEGRQEETEAEACLARKSDLQWETDDEHRAG